MARPLFPPLPPREPELNPPPRARVDAGREAAAGRGEGGATQPFVPYLPSPLAGAPPDPVDEFLEEQQRAAPSLAIVLLSAVAGIASGVIGYSLAYELGRLRLEWSVAIGTLALCFGIGATGAALSAATGSRAALPNIGLSCAVILLTILFLGFCAVAGALAATFMLAWGA